MPALDAWEALKAGNGCPFDGERSESNEHWDKIATLAVSTLYLHKIQTYRGYCVLVFDPRHVTSLGELNKSSLHPATPTNPPSVFSAFPLLDIEPYRY